MRLVLGLLLGVMWALALGQPVPGGPGEKALAVAASASSSASSAAADASDDLLANEPPAVAASASAVAAVPAASAASGVPATPRPPPIWKLEIKAPKDLEKLLRTYLDLSRDEVISRSELRRLVAGAPEQARALLEARGYFAAQIKVRVGEDVAGQPTLVQMEVEPGPLTHIGPVQVIFEGELDTKAGQGDTDALVLVEKVKRQWSLPTGEVFEQPKWSSAKNSTLALLRADGYPTATWSGTSASVDAQKQVATLFLVADSGPAFAYGPLTVDGLKRQPESAIRNLMSFRVGDPYREKQLLDFQERVQKLNLFESVFVTVSDDPAQAKAAPLAVQVRELPLQQATLGAGISSDTGPRVSVEHLHRLLFGYPWQAKSKVQWGRDESTIQSDLTSHPRAEGKRWLGAFQFLRQIDTEGTTTNSRRVRAGVQDEGERLERTSYVEYQSAAVYAQSGLKVSDASAVTATQQWIWRDVDSVILPTQGVTANVSAAVGQSFATLDASGPFARAYGRLTWYRPLPSSWYATVRTEAGLVMARPSVSVPDTLLFKAGGDESVRGYVYRSLGDVQGTVTLGGKALATGSFEVAHPLLPRIPNLWGALFVDVGDAAKDAGSLKPKWGYGAGVRWRSPVGPLRLDLAYGEAVSQFRIHFSVGIAL